MPSEAGVLAARALAAAAAGILDVQEDRVGLAHPGTRTLLALSAEHPTEEPLSAWLDRLEPTDRPAVEAAIASALAAPGDPCRLEFRLAGASAVASSAVPGPEGRARLGPPVGAARWLLASGRAEPAAGDAAPRLILLLLDVSSLRAAAERKELLLREADHRARNALSAVQAVLRLSRAEDPERFVEAVQGRVAAMVRAHGLLAAEGWRAGAGTDLTAVLTTEFAPWLGGAEAVAARVSFRGSPVALAASAVQPIAMLLHELATNAVKHGALSVPEGQVEVAWEVGPDSWLSLYWSERGGPPIQCIPARRGFGSTLIASLARGQLGGQARLFWERTGLRCEVLLPPACVAIIEADGGVT